MIAALYVRKNGVYYGLPDVDPWDEARDARLYPGPHPVVAHPPCERWGKYWHGGPNSVKYPRVRRVKGDDGGCFEAALEAVRKWGGVLEHPAYSAAWKHFGIFRPPLGGRWISSGLDGGGWTCHVEQGHYGHRARKATWLYAFRINPNLFPLKWGPSAAKVRLDEGYHSAEEHRSSLAVRPHRIERLSKTERAATPIPFRDLLLSMARSVGKP